MKSITNTRVRLAHATKWTMERTILDMPLRCSFMYSHDMIGNAHFGRKYVADRLREVRQGLRAKVGKLQPYHPHNTCTSKQ